MRTRQHIIDDAKALAEAIPPDGIEHRTLRALAALVADLAEATLATTTTTRKKK